MLVLGHVTHSLNSVHDLSSPNQAYCVSIRGSMECYDNTLRTFDTYPKQMLPDKFQLARELDCIIRVNRTFVSAFGVMLN